MKKNSTNDLLARTCNLHRLVPLQSLASVTEICPAVATDPICHPLENTTIITINQTILLLNTTNLIPSNVTINTTLLIPGDKGHLGQVIRTPQQELDAIRSKSGTKQVDIDDTHNGSSQTITFSILLMIISIYFSSN